MKRIKDYVLVCHNRKAVVFKLVKTVHGPRYVVVGVRGVTVEDRLFKFNELSSVIGG